MSYQSMSNEEGFKILQSLSSEQYATVRRHVGAALVAQYHADGDYDSGISSSDINHTAVSYIRRGEIAVENDILVLSVELSEAIYWEVC